MKKSDWKTSAELVGITAIVVSLVFLGLQMKQTQDIAVSEINASHHASFVELNNGIADHADVWFRGCAGLDLDQAELVVFRSLLGNLGEHYRRLWRHDRLFGRDSTTTEELEYAAFLYENPGAREIWSTKRDSYNASLLLVSPGFEPRLFASLVDDALKKLDE